MYDKYFLTEGTITLHKFLQWHIANAPQRKVVHHDSQRLSGVKLF